MQCLDPLAAPGGRNSYAGDQDADSEMGDCVAPSSARQMAQPPPGCQGRQLRYAAPVDQIGQDAEHRPGCERDARQCRWWCGAVEGEDDDRGENGAENG